MDAPETRGLQTADGSLTDLSAAFVRSTSVFSPPHSGCSLNGKTVIFMARRTAIHDQNATIIPGQRTVLVFKHQLILQDRPEVAAAGQFAAKRMPITMRSGSSQARLSAHRLGANKGGIGWL